MRRTAGLTAVPVMPAQTVPRVLPALVGVDIAEVSRVARAVADHGDTYVRHVLTPAERAACGSEATLVTAFLAMKECLIKAVGGRPAGFSWHDFDGRPDVSDGMPGRLDASDGQATDLLDGQVTELLDEAAERLRAGTGLPLEHQVIHRVRGASRQAALTRLDPAGAPTTSVIGVARWGRHGDTVIALALLVVDNRGVR
jgi:holo-[acyl-carrier protein] synthase